MLKQLHWKGGGGGQKDSPQPKDVGKQFIVERKKNYCRFHNDDRSGKIGGLRPHQTKPRGGIRRGSKKGNQFQRPEKKGL